MKNEQLVHYEKGQVLFRQGEGDDSLYIIQSGKVRVHINVDDKTIPLVDLERGSMVGEMSFLSGMPRTATVTAREPLWALKYPSSILEEEDYGLPEWTLSLGRQLVRRLRKTTAELAYNLQPDIQPVMLDHSDDMGADVCSFDRDPWESRLNIKGSLTLDSLNDLKDEIKHLAQKRGVPVILDFSETLDIDQGAIDFLGRLTQGKPQGAEKNLPDIKIDNVLLLRDRLREIKGLKSLLAKREVPVKAVAAGEVLLKQGEEGNALFLVKSGRLGVYRDTPQGRKLLGKIGPGELVGEMALITPGPRSATVEALEKTSVLEISTQDYRNNLYHLPSWYLKILEELVRRLRKTSDLLEKRGKYMDEGDINRGE